MKFLLKFLSYGVVASALLISCTDDAAVPTVSSPPLGSDFYPLITNRYTVYDVEEVRYSLRNGADTNRYQLQERVTDSLVGAGGEIIYFLERYTRDSSAEDWRLDSLWTARKSEQQVVVVENNVPFVKLVFPFREELQWDGNALNVRPSLTYTLTSTDSTVRQEIGTEWDELLSDSRTVVQRRLETLVNDSILVETYAPAVGLIYKKSRILQYCADQECIGQKQIESGRSYRQTLTEYGKE